MDDTNNPGPEFWRVLGVLDKALSFGGGQRVLVGFRSFGGVLEEALIFQILGI